MNKYVLMFFLKVASVLVFLRLSGKLFHNVAADVLKHLRVSTGQASLELSVDGPCNRCPVQRL